MKQKVLFICVDNSARSQIAAAKQSAPLHTRARGVVRSGSSIDDWCFANGRRLTEEEILIYNSFISKRGWHDDETGVLAEMITKFGLRDDGRVLTYFDLIEMDEGRWYPDIWRDAWR
jgi:hypothetical protein